MFHPADHSMERGWVGRIDGDRVIHLAAQTLQSYFTGGGSAREHAEYLLTDVRFLAPVLHPPAVRVFEEQGAFAFANPAAIVGPGAEVATPAPRGPSTGGGRSAGEPSNDRLQGGLSLVPRIAGVIGADGELAGITAFAEFRDPSRAPPKDRDFALGLGPLVVTTDACDPDGLEAVVRVDGLARLRGVFAGFDWAAAVDLAADGTALKPGDLIAGPGLGTADGIEPGSSVELEVEAVGVLAHTVGV
jgi:hypothetical protein